MAAVVVNVASQAGPDTPENPIFLLATEPLVTATPFLDWRPAPAGAGGAARVSLATFHALRAFIARASISRVPANVAAASTVHSLTMRLTDACWSRILTELMAANILAQAPIDVSPLHVALIPLWFGNSSPRRQSGRRHDHADLPMDVCRIAPRLSTHGNAGT